MSQYDFGTIDPTTKSGTALADLLNQWRGAEHSSHSGSVRPAYVVAGMIWLDTVSEPWKIKLYDGSADIVLMQVDPTANVPILGLGGEVDVASATTVNLAEAKSNLVRITGATAITSFGAGDAGVLRIVSFAAALTLTHGSSLIILPGATNIVTAPGDTAIMMAMGAGIWRCISYARASGSTAVNRDATVADFRAKADKLVTAQTAFQAAGLVTLTDASTIAVDLSMGINFKVSLGGYRTLGFPVNRVVGQTGRIRVMTNGYGLSYASGYIFTNGIAPALGGRAYLDYFVDEDAVHLMSSRIF